MTSLSPPPPSWALSLSTPPPRPTKPSSIPDPPGFSSSAVPGKPKSTSANASTPQKQPSPNPRDATILLKKSYELALAPAKQLPMTFLTLYMSGSSLQIFSIVMVFMAFKNPFVGLLSTFSAFERFETPETRGRLGMVRALYVLVQLAGLALGVWKVNGMGLLP
jgi:hypothetical protein